MVKTRSQTGNKTIKKEEQEDCKSTLGLNSEARAARNKIAKRRKPKNKKSISPSPGIKVEEDTDTKSLLQSTSKSSKLSKRRFVSQEQINQLIGAIVNDNMNVRKAARTVKICRDTAHYYYNQYKNDPDKKIPLPRNRPLYAKTYSTQEQVENLMRYILDDKMSISKASAKANMNYESGKHYYNKYLKDPAHNIPIPRLCQNYTQDQKNELISYIVNDKMSIAAASRKAKMGTYSGKVYYHKYFNDQNPGIRAPSHITIPKVYTQEQINKVISYIANDKMSIAAASRKANMSSDSAGNYYRQYLKDNNMELPVSKRYTQDKINEFIGYIVDDKMLIKVASKKANMPYHTGKKFYSKYVKDPNVNPPARYTQDQKNEFISYIVDDKMSIKAASKKANMTYSPGKRYYKKYAKDHNHSMILTKYTQDQKNEFIRYIVDEKMTIKVASKKANINYNSGKVYYRRYLNNQKRDSCT